MDLSLLAGNAPLKRQLELQTARRGLSHAYILSGPPGSGRRTLAGILSAALVCSSEGDGLPCGHCSNCRKARSGVHPDILRVGDDGKDITVAQVRQLRADAYIRPNEAGRKVYVLENAQSMNASAQNAMLKLLEEGPAYAAFLLITNNAAALLPTVRSRCETLALSPVAPAEAEAWLRARYPDKPAQALHEAADACEGLLGRASLLRFAWDLIPVPPLPARRRRPRSAAPQGCGESRDGARRRCRSRPIQVCRGGLSDCRNAASRCR